MFKHCKANNLAFEHNHPSTNLLHDLISEQFHLKQQYYIPLQLGKTMAFNFV